MSSKMHFRKRLLQEYQHEVGLTSFGMDNQLSPPSSVHTDNKSNSSNIPPKEWEPEIKIEEPNKTLDILPDAENYINEALVLTPKSIAILDAINKFKQRLEASFEEPTKHVASPGPKPSTLLLEKINQVKDNLHSQPMQTHSISESLSTTIPQVNSIFQTTSLIKQLCVHNQANQLQPQPCPDVSKQFDSLGNKSQRPIQKIRVSDVLNSGNRSYNEYEFFMKESITVCEEIVNVQPFASPPASEENYENQQTINNTPLHITADTIPEKYRNSSEMSSSFYDGQGSSTPVQFRRPYYHFGNNSDIENENNLYPIPSPNCKDKITIGPNNTEMLKSDYEKINWSLSTPNVTRRILMAIFGRATLATHSLSGRPSPAFKDLNKPEKLPLNTYKVADMIFIITRKKNATAKEVRMAITTKCADECKMFKGREEKKNKLSAKLEQQNQNALMQQNKNFKIDGNQ